MDENKGLSKPGFIGEDERYEVEDPGADTPGPFLDSGQTLTLNDVEENRASPMTMPFPPRQFAATPDVSNTIQEEWMDNNRPTTAFGKLPEEEGLDEESSFIEDVRARPKSFARPHSPVKRVSSPSRVSKFPLPFIDRETEHTTSTEADDTPIDVMGENERSPVPKIVEQIVTKRPPEATGRYIPLADDDTSLLKLGEMKDYVKSGQDKVDKDRQDSGPGQKKFDWHRLTQQEAQKPQEPAPAEKQGLVSTIGFLTSIVKWKTKKKGVFNKNEKYAGYLDLFNRLSREMLTSIPLPILIQVRREAFTVVHSIAKAYKSILGPHHIMTEQATAKLDKLTSEMFDDDVFI